MAKTSGLGWTTLSVDDSAGTARTILNDITDCDFSTPRALFDWTGIDKSAMERGLGLADFTISLNGIFNPTATTASHAALKTAASSTNLRTIAIAVASQTLSNECYLEGYDLKRASDGNLTWSSTAKLADGAVPTWA